MQNWIRISMGVSIAIVAAIVGSYFLYPEAMPFSLQPATAQADTTASVASPTVVAQADTKAPRTDADGAGSKSVTTTTTFGGWTVTCNEGDNAPAKVCTANFRVINKQNNSVILVGLIGRDAEGKLLAEILTTSDVMIKPGVVIALDEAPAVKAEFVSCTSKGCKASLYLTPALVEQMKVTSKAKIDVTLIDGQIIQFAMDIPGIDKALAELGL